MPTTPKTTTEQELKALAHAEGWKTEDQGQVWRHRVSDISVKVHRYLFHGGERGARVTVDFLPTGAFYTATYEANGSKTWPWMSKKQTVEMLTSDSPAAVQRRRAALKAHEEEREAKAAARREQLSKARAEAQDVARTYLTDERGCTGGQATFIIIELLKEDSSLSNLVRAMDAVREADR
jgi:hypothetical protein